MVSKIVRIVAASGALAFCMGGSAALAECDLTQVVEVEIKNMAFVPATVTACVGQTIRWTNNEPTAPRRIAHTVTADPTLARRPESVLLPAGALPFASPILAPGEKFEWVASVAGEYRYFCRPHELMGHVGAITVTE